MAGTRKKKKTQAPAEPYPITVYRVNAELRISIPAGVPLDEGRRRAVEIVQESVKLQEGGPKLFFAEPRVMYVAVAEGEGFAGGDPFRKRR